MHGAVLSLFLLAAIPPAPLTGVLRGLVVDQTGGPLPGVTIEARAAKGAAHQVRSNHEGTFSLRLPEGTYRVSASSPRLRAVHRTVKIQAGKETELTVVMKVATPVEEVTVVEKAPSVSTTTANVKEVFDLEFGALEVASAGYDLPWPDSERLAMAGDQEAYDHLTDNPFLSVQQNPLSTFAIDVDTASYANVRRFINQGQLPPAGAVRLEELINYFPYRYPAPRDGAPFAASIEVAACPWNTQARLVRVGLRGRDFAAEKRPPSNLVFLIDVSGSMAEPAKLPLVKDALRVLVNELRAQDSVAMVVYAGSSGLVLPPTPIAKRKEILRAIDELEGGGSTNGGQGIQLAYWVARQGFLKEGNNRVVLATDGDFNVGLTSQDALVRLIEKEAKSGVFLTVLGFGTGNYKDATMEKLADRGNGNYAYIDSLAEARKALGQQLAGTLFTIAKDVKIQVEMNPARVGAYRLLGYENRLLRKEDFNDDRKDGGEIGAGHTVTALYEVLPPDQAGRALTGPPVDELRYLRPAGTPATDARELLTVKVRYKAPDGETSRKLEWPVIDGGPSAGSSDLRFAAAVAAFGMLLRDSPHAGTADLALVQRLASGALDHDPQAHRRAFLELLGLARMLPGPARLLRRDGARSPGRSRTTGSAAISVGHP